MATTHNVEADTSTNPAMISDPHRGMIWDSDRFDGLPSPRWTAEPDISAIERTINSIGGSNACKVEFLDEGAFNKVYKVHRNNEYLIMRVSIPICPALKTKSEIATVEWIRRETDIPLPTILAYDSTRDNEIGFEWMLMECLPGNPLYSMSKSMSNSVKSNLVRRFAGFQASLWRKQLRGIGSIHPPVIDTAKSTSSAPSASRSLEMMKYPINSVPKPGLMMSFTFFGPNSGKGIKRGPFLSSRDWVEARIAFANDYCEEVLANYSSNENGPAKNEEAESEVKDAKWVQQLLSAMEALVPRFFPVTSQVPEPTVIFHDDLHEMNILVDDDGKLTGVLDWEGVSAMPLWKACYYPSFLHGFPRNSKPDITMYDSGKPEPGTAYFEHLEAFENTMLRNVFMEEMGKLEPEWVSHFHANKLRRDFDVALDYIHHFVARPHIRDWITSVTDGDPNPISLQEALKC